MAPTVMKDPVCSRVNAQKVTSHFGTFCDGSCGGAVTPVEVPAGETAAPTDAPATPISNTIPYRCGANWVAANSACGATCMNDADCATAGEGKCFADMTNICSAPVMTAAPTTAGFAGTLSPTQAPPSTRTSDCKATGAWSGSTGMNSWCAINCPTVCPASHCVCTAGANYISSKNVLYQPSCQEYTTVFSNETMSSIAHTYDLSSYELDQNEVNAAQALLDYNKQCSDIFDNVVIGTALPSLTKLFITGDCQLTDKCEGEESVGDGGDGSHATRNNQIRSIPIIISILLAKVL